MNEYDKCLCGSRKSRDEMLCRDCYRSAPLQVRRNFKHGSDFFVRSRAANQLLLHARKRKEEAGV